MTTRPHGKEKHGKVKIGLVQMCSGRSIEHNLIEASRLIREAAKAGARYVQTPEVTTIMELDKAKLRLAVQPEEGNAALAHFRALAKELGLWLHVGSMSVVAGADKLANRGFLIAPTGSVAARYDKIHLFDVDLPNGETYRESRTFVAGTKAVLAELPWGKLGISICYDLRFPHLYRTLAKAGATMLAIPAAFTQPTGEAHWHVLMRARAIETECFVLAAAQAGTHENGRKTYGHSLVVAPWGEVIAEAKESVPQVVLAELDLAAVAAARAKVPSLDHDRPFELQTCPMPPNVGAAKVVA